MALRLGVLVPFPVCDGLFVSICTFDESFLSLLMNDSAHAVSLVGTRMNRYHLLR
jgi:hypothetical protein